MIPILLGLSMLVNVLVWGRIIAVGWVEGWHGVLASLSGESTEVWEQAGEIHYTVHHRHEEPFFLFVVLLLLIVSLSPLFLYRYHRKSNQDQSAG
jgi:hypothetical protein